MTGSPEASTPQTSEKLPLPIRLIDGLSGLSAALAAAGLVLLALNVFLDVLGRTFLHRAIPGTIDMTINWWMPMLALLAFGYTEKMQDHIKVTVLLDSLPIGLRRAIEGIFSLLAAVLLMFLAFYTWVDAARSAKIGETTSSSQLGRYRLNTLQRRFASRFWPSPQSLTELTFRHLRASPPSEIPSSVVISPRKVPYLYPQLVLLGGKTELSF